MNNRPEARGHRMENNNDKYIQDQLEEAYEHDKDHPVTREEYEIPEETLKSLYEKMRKSQEMSQRYIAAQNKLWGIVDEKN